jgi:chorismate mutase / prephenate dehydrogenase
MRNLDELRVHLNRLDTALVHILAERMNVIPEVGGYKAAMGVPRYQPEREAEVIYRQRGLAEDLGLNPDLIEDVYRSIIGDAHRIEKVVMGE